MTSNEAFIKVTPKNSIADRRIDVFIKGLPPNKTVTVHSHCIVGNGDKFECVAHYDTGARGEIDLSKDCSLGGNYTGVEHGGILWAMTPSLENKHKYARFIKKDVTIPLVVYLYVYSEVIDSIEDLQKLRCIPGKLDEIKLAETSFNRWHMAPGTKRISLTIEKDGILGTMFLPSGDGPFPGVLVLFGSNKGILEFKSALLASHGFASLILAYYGMSEVVTEENDTANIKLDYFRKGVAYLANHERVKKSGIGVVSLSFSTGISLMMAEVFPEIKSLVWINGFTQACFSSISYKDMKYKSAPYYMENLITDSKNIAILRHLYHFKPLPESTIKFYNRRDVAFLFIAGMDDLNTPSDYFISDAERLLEESNHPNYKILRYPGTGHLLEPAYSVHNGLSPQKVLPFNGVHWGGSRIEHCKAQDLSWNEQLSFLSRTLDVKISSKI